MIGDRNLDALLDHLSCYDDEDKADKVSRGLVDMLKQRARDLGLEDAEVCIVCLDPFVNCDHSDC